MTDYLIIPEKDRLTESLKLAQTYGLGFEYNDFFHPNILSDTVGTEAVLQLYRNVKLPAYTTMHGAFFDVTIHSEDKEIRRISEQRMSESMEIAKRLGVKAVIFHTNLNPFLTSESYRCNWLETNVSYLSELSIRYPDINIYMENMFDKTPDDLMKLAKRMEHTPNFGICLDYAHAFLSSTPLEEWVHTLAPYIRHVHINDNDGVEDLHLALGDGIIDWDMFFNYKESYFPKATVLIETSSLKAQERSLQFLKGLKT